jgi:hypothetical protein
MSKTRQKENGACAVSTRLVVMSAAMDDIHALGQKTAQPISGYVDNRKLLSEKSTAPVDN